MAITEKECECGCGKKFWGTSRRKFLDNTCKNKQWRKDNKAKEQANGKAM